MPNGTSYRPGRSIWPDTQNSFGPGDFPVPIFRYSSAPPSTINGTLQKVSTLLMTVGLPNKPDVVGKGGLMRGSRGFLPLISAAQFLRRQYTRRPQAGFQSPTSTPG